MSSTAPQAQKDAVQLAPAESVAVQQNPPISEVSFKRRLSERYSVPGALVLCHRRTIIGTWKAAETPFHVYNIGMGGVNFWSLGMPHKRGAKIKLTLVMPKVQPINVVGVVVWIKDMPRSDGGNGARHYSQITGVKFVDYDAGAWAVLRQIPQIVAAESQGDAPSTPACTKEQPEESPASATFQAAWPQSPGCAQTEPCEGQ